jgi:hypothetical protein
MPGIRLPDVFWPYSQTVSPRGRVFETRELSNCVDMNLSNFDQHFAHILYVAHMLRQNHSRYTGLGRFQAPRCGGHIFTCTCNSSLLCRSHFKVMRRRSKKILEDVPTAVDKIAYRLLLPVLSVMRALTLSASRACALMME